MNRTKLQMPQGIERDEATYTDTYGKFIIQPLERGFGVTLGNSFRRVLLSSLTGAAITHVRFDGVLHEFSSIPGVVEDVSEIILNLKQVWIRLLNKRPDKIMIDLKGPCVFTAADIQAQSADFDILNPEHEIATLDKGAELKIEIRIGRGRGYIPAEENKMPDQPIGTIPLDSVFNPIRKVNYKIENTRVGHRTDYERLILELETNGSVTPDDALTFAGKIIKDHIELFISFDVEPEEEDESSQIDEDVLRIRKLLKMSVDELELSVRSYNCLKSASIDTIGDLVRRDEQEMLRFRNFGRKSLQELSKILEEKGITFGMDVDKYLKSEES
ncbi:DNA-directed RNA polymerase subunit alpha [bacterium]|nr:DNA-directed RNA polymerase subunit alpha [bacterium]